MQTLASNNYTAKEEFREGFEGGGFPSGYFCG